MTFDEALAAFVAQLDRMMIEEWKRAYHVFDPPHFETMNGPKYVRIVRADGASRSAYAFIEKATGDILKPDGWKKPAKHARGNIYRTNPTDGCGAYGVAYLR